METALGVGEGRNRSSNSSSSSKDGREYGPKDAEEALLGAGEEAIGRKVESTDDCRDDDEDGGMEEEEVEERRVASSRDERVEAAMLGFARAEAGMMALTKVMRESGLLLLLLLLTGIAGGADFEASCAVVLEPLVDAAFGGIALT